MEEVKNRSFSPFPAISKSIIIWIPCICIYICSLPEHHWQLTTLISFYSSLNNVHHALVWDHSAVATICMQIGQKLVNWWAIKIQTRLTFSISTCPDDQIRRFIVCSYARSHIELPIWPQCCRWWWCWISLSSFFCF